MIIDAYNLDYRSLNDALRNTKESCEIVNCCGQRYIGAGMSGKNISINGIPGNALGVYLNDSVITVNSNAQDAVGDTMNDGKIIVYGNIGDTAGYAMRGGKIYVKGNAGYRTGIHMKEYKDKYPVIVIGGKCGNFLGEYQAGGKIIVLGLNLNNNKEIVGQFPCTGMHGGEMFLRSDCRNISFPEKVIVKRATEEDLNEIDSYITEFCELFGYEKNRVLDSPFTKVIPDKMNPYKQMYVAN